VPWRHENEGILNLDTRWQVLKTLHKSETSMCFSSNILFAHICRIVSPPRIPPEKMRIHYYISTQNSARYFTISYHIQVFVVVANKPLDLFKMIIYYTCQTVEGKHSDLLGFWSLSIVWYSRLRTQHFGNWICFHPQVREEEHLLSWVP
jgi:hypothetical protein